VFISSGVAGEKTTDPMNRMNKLNHFTTFSAVKGILKEGMRFSTGCNWQDKNDAELLALYREITGNINTGVLCFLNDDETVYHWTYFSKDDLKEACCIEFKKKELLQNYLYDKDYLCQEVQYDVLKEVHFSTPNELLFTKRHPYRFEREYRIVSLNGGYIQVKDYINKITLSPDLSEKEYKQRKQDLLTEFGLTCDINQSTVFENPEWIGKAEELKLREIYSIIQK
jgi:hypothetical protein